MAKEYEERVEQQPYIVERCRNLFDVAINKTVNGHAQFVWPVRGETGIIEMVGLEPQDYHGATDRFVVFGPSLEHRPVSNIALDDGILTEYQVFQLNRQTGDERPFELLRLEELAAARLYAVTAAGNVWELNEDHFEPVQPAAVVSFDGTRLASAAPEWIKL